MEGSRQIPAFERTLQRKPEKLVFLQSLNRNIAFRVLF